MKLKKYISLFLVIMLILNAGGYFFIYLGLLSNFKSEASKRINDFIDDSEMTLIKVPNGDYAAMNIHWTEDNEFEMDDEMYDVFKTENINGVVFLYCLSDKNEDNLNIAFSHFIDQFSKQGDRNLISTILNIYLALSTPALAPDISFSIFQNDYTEFIPIYKSLYESISISITTPPPRVYRHIV